ncbi:hypothetical protein B0J13DRAFT_529679 [Dactylonectria estremocensis]|uniref:Uncharacterized protein n=1 Tax=Dactylonectria estremocensis TaxID=1079267 RepID=A0A9P9ITD4_9HYPO|nr:hypothetical protein B0J13DRAFT_529679 [Dactylonectria estremocensis]
MPAHNTLHTEKMAATTSSPLLSLPFELRNQVYLEVLFCTIPKPEKPEALGIPHYRIYDKPNFDTGGYITVPYPPVNTNSHGLLRVNSQVRCEVSILLEDLRSKGKLIYDLDLAVEPPDVVVATPRCFPAPMGRIPILRADLRFFGEYDYRDTRASLWGWSLTCFLKMFLSRKPDPRPRARQESHREQVTIEKLVINIVTAPMVPGDSARRLGGLRPGEKEGDVDDLEMRLRFVESELHYQLRQCPWHDRDTELLYERIGTIETWAGGSLRRKWRMSGLLPGTNVWDKPETIVIMPSPYT